MTSHPFRSCLTPRRGYTLLELIVALGILSGAFVALLTTISFLGRGMAVETAFADQSTRTSGTLFDIVAELREAAAFSPNFHVEINPLNPPAITFDKIDGVDSNGNVLWGSKITYRLEKVNTAASAQFEANHTGITQGRVVREEVFTSTADPRVSVIEENVPYQITRNGAPNWGFNVMQKGSAITVTLSRFGETGVDAAAPVQGTQTADTGQSMSPLSAETYGSTALSTVQGVYWLKNPQVVIPAE